jgi:hypothetical protein
MLCVRCGCEARELVRVLVSIVVMAAAGKDVCSTECIYSVQLSPTTQCLCAPQLAPWFLASMLSVSLAYREFMWFGVSK